tara:strand:+ start:700 stop:1170 length:471 start_codon:yes stop_codon:yes gene_type:complete
MDEFAQINEGLEKQATAQSLGPGYYHRNAIKAEGTPVYPWAPTARIQKIGGALLDDQSLVDVDSELMGLTRKNSNDPNTHYKPDENKILKYINLEDGFFHQESSLLNNPPSLLRGQVKNRWENVHKDPMQNILEPFNRLGEDTYLSTMDNDDTCDK